MPSATVGLHKERFSGVVLDRKPGYPLRAMNRQPLWS
jgi:hypothetical protein